MAADSNRVPSGHLFYHLWLRAYAYLSHGLSRMLCAYFHASEDSTTCFLAPVPLAGVEPANPKV